MATDKKGFLLYADQKELFEQLPNDKAGELIKHIFRYVNDENPETDDIILKLAFTPIKQQLKRDLKKFEERADRSRENGKKGGRPKTQKTQQVNLKPKKPDNDNVNDNVNDIKDTNVSKAFESKSKFLEWFNGGKKHYTGSEGKTKDLKSTDLNNFNYLNKTYSRQDFAHALKLMSYSKWVQENAMFTPAHFLRSDNFTKYLNQELKDVMSPDEWYQYQLKNMNK